MNLRETLLIAPLLAAGCASNTSFTQTGSDVTEVQGAADMSYSPAELVWTDLSVGITYSQNLVLDSFGEVDLQIYNAEIINDLSGTFYLPDYDEGATVNVAPGAIRELTLTAALTTAGSATAELWLQTNVSDQLNVYIPLSASPAAPTDTGDTGGGDTGDTGDTGQ